MPSCNSENMKTRSSFIAIRHLCTYWVKEFKLLAVKTRYSSSIELHTQGSCWHTICRQIFKSLLCTRLYNSLEKMVVGAETLSEGVKVSLSFRCSSFPNCSHVYYNGNAQPYSPRSPTSFLTQVTVHAGFLTFSFVSVCVSGPNAGLSETDSGSTVTLTRVQGVTADKGRCRTVIL